MALRPGTLNPWLGGSWVPSVRSFVIPEGITTEFLGGALEVWWPLGSFPRRGRILPGFRASAGPVRMAVLVFPYAKAIGEPPLL